MTEDEGGKNQLELDECRGHSASAIPGWTYRYPADGHMLYHLSGGGNLPPVPLARAKAV